MSKEDAENIQTVTQGCIRELGMLMQLSKSRMSENEFNEFKSNVAQAMGRLIDIEEFHVYKNHPELRPYKLTE